MIFLEHSHKVLKGSAFIDMFMFVWPILIILAGI